MQKAKFSYFAALIVLVLLVNLGCNKEEPAIENIPVVSEEMQAQIDDSLIIDYIDKNNLSFVKHDSAFYYHIINEGNDSKPSYYSVVSAKYKGYFLNGVVFDDSKDNIIQFSLRQVIKGWTYGLPLIGEGGKIELILPSRLGYGSTAYAGIPANAILIFEVELSAIAY